jgi:hypothetical protein
MKSQHHSRRQRPSSSPILSLALMILFYAALAYAQLELEVRIEGTATTNINTQTLGSSLVSSGINTGWNTITSDSSSILLVDKCPTGTYSKDGQACVDCPAGTASPVEGAASPMTCSACSTGSFSAAASSVCTDCPVNTFSVTYMAANRTQCLSCPPHSTSPTRSNQVEDCVCDSGYFTSDNILSPFDSILEALGFEGALSINIPHVVC